ncbi:hypothetical protein ACHABQ_02890 [Nesterenkonia aurantiaca]|uniref:hypothetical protein n=1 Tax=Nesterenkonia aurantiaca TaxID=1436010 RepID=UPI003EE611EB
MIGGHPLSGILQGAKYEVTGLPGWWERPAVKSAEIPRERADGDFLTPWDFEARYCGINGFITAKGHGQMHHIMDQLNGLCATHREWLTIQGHGPTTSALVEVHGSPYIGTENDHMARFELRFKANDPRRTGDDRAVRLTSTYADIFQLGNYPATPTFDVTVANAPGGYRLIGRASETVFTLWEYPYPITSVEEHHVDFGTGKHFVNGVEMPSRLRAAETFDVLPNSRTRARVELFDGGSVTTLMRYRDTWI